MSFPKVHEDTKLNQDTPGLQKDKKEVLENTREILKKLKVERFDKGYKN